MSSKKAVVPARNHIGSIDFIDEMLPASEKTALLFNLSYLCLAKFPSLERTIRARAFESQMLFSSSEAILLQCVNTSDNMAKTLLPMLKVSVEKENGIIVVRFLEKARAWIDDIIKEVDRTAEEYKRLNTNVATATSDIVETKSKTEEKIKKMNKEEEIQKKRVQDYKTNLYKIQSKLNEVNGNVKEAYDQLQKIALRNSKYAIATVVPIIGWFVNSVQRVINDPKDHVALDSAKEKLQRLQQDQNKWRNEEWKAQTELMKYQINLSIAKFVKGVVPSPTHLTEVQSSLSKIQKILLDLKSFWEKFGVVVTNLKQRTFASEDLVEFLNDSTFKQMFLDSLEDAEKEWQMFGRRCQNIMRSLNSQSKDSYKFLETNPSSLPPEEWQKQYDAVTVRLNSVYTALPQLKHTEDQQDMKTSKRRRTSKAPRTSKRRRTSKAPRTSKT